MNRFKSIKWYFKKKKWIYLLALLISIITVGLNAIQPRIFGNTIDLIGLQKITSKSLTWLLILLGVVIISKYLFSILKRVVIGHLFHNLFYQLKIRFMEKLLIQDATFFTKYHSGDLMTRATNETHMISNVSTNLIFGIIELFITIIVAAIFMIMINWKMMIFAIIPLPFIFVVVVKIRPKISKNWRDLRAKSSELSNKAMESVQHVKLIRAFVNEENDNQRLADVALECYKIERKSIYLQSIFGPTFRLFTIISQLIALGYGSYCVMNQIITVGELITFNLFLSQFSFPMLQLGNQIAMLSQSSVAFERINEILLSEPIIKDPVDPLTLKGFSSLKLNNIYFTYPTGDTEVLKGINLTINDGSTIGIVGKTGSGKTTLVRQLLRQYPVDRNYIILNDHDINDYRASDVRQLVAYVPQEHMLFSRTVNNNLVIGEPIDIDQETRINNRNQAIKLADFEKDLPYLPMGLETMVGEYGVTLSGGQKQRLSIARAFLKDAPILILDDSLSAVDGTTEANIIRNLKQFRKNKTNIIVAHRLSAVEHADEIVVIDDGQIIERGTHNQLMNLKGWYYTQYETQLMEPDHE